MVKLNVANFIAYLVFLVFLGFVCVRLILKYVKANEKEREDLADFRKRVIDELFLIRSSILVLNDDNKE